MGVPRYTKYPGPIDREASDNFSQVTNPATGRPYFKGRHNANDLKASVPGKFGETVWAGFKRGVVAAVRTPEQTGAFGNAFGNRVWVKWRYEHDHKDGTVHTHSWYTFDAHLQKVTVQEGQEVGTETKTKKLGTMGGSGRSGPRVFPPHDHHMLMTGKEYLSGIDPHRKLERCRQRELKARAAAGTQ